MELEHLGPYRIGRRLGKGGMGSVYEAVDRLTGRRVAVKALTPQLAMADGFRERFEAEIESLKKLEHEGIVRLYGYGEENGVLFYSMELVEGASLEQELHAGRRFDWRETLSIAIQVCRALKHAHDAGVVHRDIKPANLLLTPDDRVKIADFGIARLFGATQLTTAGGVLGTADYMAPEQVDGRAVTEKCDQYALGCVMFALLAGRPPFRAKTMPEMLQMQRYAEPEPVRRYAPEAPAQLDGLIRQLLNKEPADRFPNVMVLARHMEAMQKALARPTEPNGQTASGAARGTAGELNMTAAYGSDATQAPAPGEPPVPLETTDSGVYDAPTLADGGAGVRDDADAGPTTLPPAEAKRQELPDSRERRFTTVDHDAERAREAESERWIMWLQLAGLAAALVALAGIGWLLTRPATADALYGTIAASAEEDGVDSLRNVADEIEEFLDRFPEHERSAEVRAFADELELQRLERQLRVRARLAKDEPAHPAAAIYAEAVAVSESNPARGAAMLADLLTLYKMGSAPEDTPAEDRAFVVLAERQLGILRTTLQKQATDLLPALKQRLAVAKAVEKSNAERAVRMYEAIVDLYGDDLWAKGVVDEAKSRLKALTDP